MDEFLSLHPDLQLDHDLTDAVVGIVEQGYDKAFRLSDLAPFRPLALKIDDDPRALMAFGYRAGVPMFSKTRRDMDDVVSLS